jgi:translation elongation factor EF-Ts
MADRFYFLAAYSHQPDKFAPAQAAAVVTLSSATDFAARTAEARTLSERLAMLACGFRAATPAELLAVEAPCLLAREGRTVADDLAALSRLLGEGVRVEAVALVLAGAPSA